LLLRADPPQRFHRAVLRNKAGNQLADFKNVDFICPYPGTDVMILKKCQKNGEKMAFFAQTATNFCNKNYRNIGFLRKSHFFAENRRK
jgi:hypothetical protein